MMSYLWILLISGALLAGLANTQDDVAPTEDADVHSTLLPEIVEHFNSEAVEELVPEREPEPTEAGPHEEGTPAEGEAQPDAVSQAEPEPEDLGEEESQADPTADEEPGATTEGEAEVAPEEEEPAAPEEDQEATAQPEQEADAEEEPEAAEEPEPTVEPAAEPEPDAGAEATGEPETKTPVEPAAEPEPEAAAEPAEEPEATEEVTPSPQGPAAGPDDPESAHDIADVDEEPSAGADVTHAHDEHGSEDEGTAGADAAVPHDESAHAGVEVDVGTDIKPQVPSDGGLNLEDALSQSDAQDTPAHSGRSKSAGSVAHVAEATGEAADAEESGSGFLAAILCAVGVAVAGAGTAYYTYHRKKLCFKNLHEEDPEAARKVDAGEAQSDPQVLSNLLNSS
ncbi:retinitis pigmentosa 1-like 1 protein [Syngnathus acus]|uniref:retinitis pigmentosa 1-like 1 protein n=1 Tax=Syngnathus acus TaxID=161584 RepID=UPI001885D463|nr:retinitis pigmentosa 1-like 1 protein [Syngnathus acus]